MSISAVVPRGDTGGKFGSAKTKFSSSRVCRLPFAFHRRPAGDQMWRRLLLYKWQLCDCRVSRSPLRYLEHLQRRSSYVLDLAVCRSFKKEMSKNGNTIYFAIPETVKSKNVTPICASIHLRSGRIMWQTFPTKRNKWTFKSFYLGRQQMPTAPF